MKSLADLFKPSKFTFFSAFQTILQVELAAGQRRGEAEGGGSMPASAVNQLYVDASPWFMPVH